MSNLSDLQLDDGYRTFDAAILEGFYLPCLARSMSYDRSVGYFNSGALALALCGISAFLKNEGRVRLVASPNLAPEDLEAIERGYESRAVIEAAAVRCTADVVDGLPYEQRRLLRWLIANDRLDIRLAVMDGPAPALYHEKRGIFRDSNGNVVTFTGSSNETAAALRKNFESIEVFRSWVVGENRRTERHVRDFTRLWEGEQVGVTVATFPHAARMVILASAPDDTHDPTAFDLRTSTAVTQERDLHPYQKDAVRAWFSNQARGLLQMPTGSGKTITALYAARTLLRDYEKRAQPLGIVIVAPFKDLVEQWDAESRNFSFNPVPCYETWTRWESRLLNLVTAVGAGRHTSFTAITTNATFPSNGFQAALAAFPGDLLLIADEAHNIGSAQSRTLLSPRFKFRLGLSATPERWYDEEGTQALFDYFGGVVFSMTMKEAIDRGALTPYRYYVHPVTLDQEETVEFMSISDKISKLAGFASLDDESSFGDQLKLLLIKRATVIANAREKPALLESLVRADAPQKDTLVYCGVGSLVAENGAAIRVVEDISRRLNGMLLRAASYTAETPSDARALLRRDFADGRIQYLVAMRCLDEGVDIPSTQRAYFLASSTNPRQFIQRRGRVLRLFPGKRRAEVHDMVTFLSPLVGGSDNYEAAALGKELRRIRQFAEIAQNGDEVMGILSDLVKDPSVFFAE